MENLKIILPALIALCGTIIGIFFAYRQWKKQYNINRSGTAITDKQTAYKSIWSELEEAHLYVRSESFEKQRFIHFVRKVNIEMMQSGLYLAQGEKKLVNDYLKSLEILAETLDVQNNDSLREEINDTFYSTQEIPLETLKQSQDLYAAYNQVEEKRNDLIKRFRKEIGLEII